MIELVIAIAVLGILAAFALPRFGNFISLAQSSTHDSVVSSLNSAIGIAHAQWISNGSVGSVTLDGGATITMNASGYPDVGNTYAAATPCKNLINALLSATVASGTTTTVGFNSVSNSCTLNNTSWSNIISLGSNAAI